MLVLEKIRGKPLPVKVMWIMQLFGLVCILLLFVLLTWNDIARIIHG
jgi:membrane-associated protease RseP (regulator of RpoE activity)